MHNVKVGKIEKGMPVIAKTRGEQWQSLANKLEVCDSVLITTEDENKRRLVQSSIHGTVARIQGKKFATRKISTTELRLWRTK